MDRHILQHPLEVSFGALPQILHVFLYVLLETKVTWEQGTVENSRVLQTYLHTFLLIVLTAARIRPQRQDGAESGKY